jgi:glycosyltransferase involved in cell wall biosynthesis
MKNKIALVVSHPIQHFCPQYVSFAKNKDVEFKVFFGSMLGFKKYYDPNFKKEISWGDLRIDDFNHVFVNQDQVIASDKNLDAPKLDVLLDEFKPDLIITYGYFQKLQRRAHRWALKNKVKLAYISDSELRHSRNRLKELLKYFFIKKYFSGIDYFLTVGDANEDFYKYYRVPPEKMINMHFPINISHFEKSFADKNQLNDLIRSEHKIGSDDIVLAVVGKLVAWKNQGHIIEAMKMLENQGTCMHLFVLGSGETLEDLKQSARLLERSVVHFPGFVTPEKLPSYYAATDIYVHPASLEPHSIAISEAIYMECPVVLSDRCGSYGKNDDVQENRNGLVYQFGKIDKLAEKINFLVNNKKMRMDFSEQSKIIARQFQKQSHYQVLDELLASMNNQNSGA